MENSDKIFFEDDSQCWYIALGERWMGPLKASEVYNKIQKRQLTWAHFVWRKGQSQWKRICDVKPFQGFVPQQPSHKPQVRTKTATQEVKRPQPEPKIWYLYYNETQYGPFSHNELAHFLHIG